MLKENSDNLKPPHIVEQDQSASEISTILSIIDGEIERSLEFGLELLPEEIEKEKQALIKAAETVLPLFDDYVDNDEFSRIYNLVSNQVYKELEEINRKYFQHFKDLGGIRTTYNAHIETVVSAILQYLVNR